MTDSNLIFSPPMVNALLAGRKTMTRRILTPQPVWEPETTEGVTFGAGWSWRGLSRWPLDGPFAAAAVELETPQPGDRIYVRETSAAVELDSGQDVVRYAADGAELAIQNSAAAADQWLVMHTYRNEQGAPVPAIHMPRWASRITLVITDLRIERLQEISELDAIAEGVDEHPNATGWFKNYRAENEWFQTVTPDANGRGAGVASFGSLWDSLNGKPGKSWTDNPWVKVICFDAVQTNIDLL